MILFIIFFQHNIRYLFNALTNELIYEKDKSFAPDILGQLVIEDVELPSYFYEYSEKDGKIHNLRYHAINSI